MSMISSSTPVLCNTFLGDVQNGLHQDRHVYKVALFGKDAKLGRETASYSSQGEISGRGYPSGGQTLSGRSVVNGSLKFSDATFPNAAFTASQALIYNASSNGRALCVIPLGGDQTVQDASFTLRLSEAPLIELVGI